MSTPEPGIPWKKQGNDDSAIPEAPSVPSSQAKRVAAVHTALIDKWKDKLSLIHDLPKTPQEGEASDHASALPATISCRVLLDEQRHNQNCACNGKSDGATLGRL